MNWRLQYRFDGFNDFAPLSWEQLLEKNLFVYKNNCHELLIRDCSTLEILFKRSTSAKFFRCWFYDDTMFVSLDNKLFEIQFRENVQFLIRLESKESNVIALTRKMAYGRSYSRRKNYSSGELFNVQDGSMVYSWNSNDIPFFEIEQSQIFFFSNKSGLIYKVQLPEKHVNWKVEINNMMQPIKFVLLSKDIICGYYRSPENVNETIVFAINPLNGDIIYQKDNLGTGDLIYNSTSNELISFGSKYIRMNPWSGEILESTCSHELIPEGVPYVSGQSIDLHNLGFAVSGTEFVGILNLKSRSIEHIVKIPVDSTKVDMIQPITNVGLKGNLLYVRDNSGVMYRFSAD